MRFALVHRRTDGDCVPYYYPPVGDAIHSFPPIWQPASILPDDTNAQAKWEDIEPNVPTSIQPKVVFFGP